MKSVLYRCNLCNKTLTRDVQDLVSDDTPSPHTGIGLRLTGDDCLTVVRMDTADIHLCGSCVDALSRHFRAHRT